MELKINPRSATALIGLGVMVLMVACGVALTLEEITGKEELYGLVPIFNVGLDANVPTWWSSLMLLFCALLLAVIAAEHGRRADAWSRAWWVLAAIVGFLSIDEVAKIHEELGNRLGSKVLGLLGRPGHSGGATWVYGYLIPLVLCILIFTRFYLRLPRRTQFFFGAAVATYVAGAMGVESIAHGVYPHVDEWVYWAVTMVEEFLEMLGALILTYGLLDYIATTLGGTTLRVDIGRGTPPVPGDLASGPLNPE